MLLNYYCHHYCISITSSSLSLAEITTPLLEHAMLDASLYSIAKKKSGITIKLCLSFSNQTCPVHKNMSKCAFELKQLEQKCYANLFYFIFFLIKLLTLHHLIIRKQSSVNSFQNAHLLSIVHTLNQFL